MPEAGTETASEHHGFLEGALESGERVVRELGIGSRRVPRIPRRHPRSPPALSPRVIRRSRRDVRWQWVVAVALPPLVVASSRVRVLEIAPDAPAELAAIADRALMKDPSSRYPGAKEIADEIAAWQDGRTVRAYDYSSWELLRRFVKSNRAATIAATSILAAALVATALVWRSLVAEAAARELAERRAAESATARESAEAAALRAEMSLAQALLERGERALREGDPAGAAVYAAAALARDPASPGSPAYAGDRPWDEATRRAARERVERARSLYADAEVARGWVFERAIASVARGAAVSPDGTFVIAPARGGLERIDLSTGERALLAIEGVSVDAVTAFVDARRVLLRAGEASGVYELDGGTRLYATPEYGSAASSGATLAILGEDGVLSLRDAESGAERARAQTRHRSRGSPVVLSPDGTRVAVLGRAHGLVEVWPASLAGEPAQYDLGGWARHAASSPDGTLLAVTLNAPDVRVIDLSDGAVLRVPTSAWANGITWLDGDRLAVVEEEEVTIRDFRTGRAFDHLHLPVLVGSAPALWAGLHRIVLLPVLSGQSARVFREMTGAERDSRAVGAVIESIRWDAPRSRVVCLAGRAVIAIDLRRRRLGVATTIATLPEGAGLGHDLAIAEDGAIAVGTSTSAIVLVTPDGTARVVGAGDPDRVATVTSVAFSPDGQTIFAGVNDRRERRVRRVTREGAELDPIATGAHVYAVAFSPDGRRVAFSQADGDVRILDVTREMRPLRTLTGHERLAGDAEFSPDGRRIATSDGGGTIRVFDAETGEMLEAAHVHRDWVNRVTWSPDGRHLVTASDDGTVRVLAADTLRTLRILDTTGSTLRAEMTRDGDLVAYDGARVLRVTAIPPHLHDDPSPLLEQAEQRAGVRLQGLELVAVE